MRPPSERPPPTHTLGVEISRFFPPVPVGKILILRHQLNIHRRHQPKRPAFNAMDRLIFVGLYRLVPNTVKALTIVKPDTVIRWHCAGFRLYWRWKSRHRCGRPAVPLEIRRLIREMSIANPLWGAPRIHGELLKLSIDQTSVAKYMARRRGPPSQGRSFATMRTALSQWTSSSCRQSRSGSGELLALFTDYGVFLIEYVH